MQSWCGTRRRHRASAVRVAGISLRTPSDSQERVGRQKARLEVIAPTTIDTVGSTKGNRRIRHELSLGRHAEDPDCRIVLLADRRSVACVTPGRTGAPRVI